MRVPDHIRKDLRRRLWGLADEVGWTDLSPSAKSSHYENWTRDPDIGGRLSRFMDRSRVRVYLKDTLLKEYTRTRSGDAARPFRVLGLSGTANTAATYEKPHGRRLENGRVVCWGRAEEWKSVLMAVHERAYASDEYKPYGVILTHAVGRFKESRVRALVGDAATKLGVERLIWLES